MSSQNNEQSTRQRILELREEDPHISQSDICRKTSRSRQRIHQLLKDMQLPLNPRNDFIEQRVKGLYEENPHGFNASNIAKNLGCTKGKVENIVSNLHNEHA